MAPKHPPFTVILVCCMISPVSASTPIPRADRIFFVGNSFTEYLMGGIRDVLRALYPSSPSDLATPHMDLSEYGINLRAHYNNTNTLNRIDSGDYDVVVLQDMSSGPVDSHAIFVEYARLLDERIRNAGSRTVLYQTWPLVWKDNYMSEFWPPLRDAYDAMGEELGAPVVPVGRAFACWDTLHPEIPLFGMADQHHTSPLGNYFKSLVFYACLTGESPVGLTATWVGAGEEYTIAPHIAIEMQQVAFDIVTEFFFVPAHSAPSTRRHPADRVTVIRKVEGGLIRTAAADT
ncbi:MAG: hypothetical protein GF331_23255, partial [Chitinivibrionales bacterium]|nr:hypothetical protein [Chitinivibrionales bacterium]